MNSTRLPTIVVVMVLLAIAQMVIVAHADSKADALIAELRARLAASEAERTAAIRDKATTAAALKTITDQAAAHAREAESSRKATLDLAVKTRTIAEDALRTSKETKQSVDTTAKGVENLSTNPPHVTVAIDNKSLDDTIKVALIFSFTGLLTGIGSPILMAILTNRQRRKDKKEDYERQDAVAAKVEESNQRVAETAKDMSAKMEQIHTLVNSNLTASMQNELDALNQLLEVELASDDGDQGKIQITQHRVSELMAQLNDRREQTEIAQNELETDKAK